MGARLTEMSGSINTTGHGEWTDSIDSNVQNENLAGCIESKKHPLLRLT